ncbi:hypothetical protein [Desulfonatronum thioautotrophicum]|uniref:hypothetical protein n=1 Tax=Desulfonatronum thioautotrophicum TaxID=617001 RepID=UPI000ABC03EE|nr:hypothetical protein [Desulfonatronum thioautotrophicum]
MATVDLCLGCIPDAVADAGGIAVITSDHGNAECMWTEKNGKRSPMVAHTLNSVPFIVKDFHGQNTLRLTSAPDPPA